LLYAATNVVGNNRDSSVECTDVKKRWKNNKKNVKNIETLKN